MNELIKQIWESKEVRSAFIAVVGMVAAYLLVLFGFVPDKAAAGAMGAAFASWAFNVLRLRLFPSSPVEVPDEETKE